MAEEIQNGISFDKEHWPKGGTTIAALAVDFNTLWETHEEQLTTLVAEQLIADPPFVSMDDPAKIVIYLWEIGGDQVCQHVSLVELLGDYSSIAADGLDETEIDPALKAIDELQVAIDRVRNIIQRQKETAE